MFIHHLLPHDGLEPGYQWAYSSVSASGPWTDITGATSATFTPSAVGSPFNSTGTYYIIRKAILNSANNISGGTYTATSESNAVRRSTFQKAEDDRYFKYRLE